jgi:hypothetical protein
MTMIHERNRKTTNIPTKAIIIADTTTAIVITTTIQTTGTGTIGAGTVIDVGARQTTKMDSGCLRSSSSREGSRMGQRRRMTLILGAGGVFRRRNASTSEAPFALSALDFLRPRIRLGKKKKEQPPPS